MYSENSIKNTFKEEYEGYKKNIKLMVIMIYYLDLGRSYYEYKKTKKFNYKKCT